MLHDSMFGGFRHVLRIYVPLAIYLSTAVSVSEKTAFKMVNHLFLNNVKLLTVLWFGMWSGHTVETAGFGGTCATNADCSLADTACFNGTCLCDPIGLNYDPGSQTCIPGCTVYGSTYQEYIGFEYSGDVEECFRDFFVNQTIEECKDSCNKRERCLCVIDDIDEIGLCWLSSCSILFYASSWTGTPVTHYVRNCAGNNVIADCPEGEEYSLTSNQCVDCPVTTYKPDALVSGLCMLCPSVVKTDGIAQISVNNCIVPFFYCDTMSDCPSANMECLSNTCSCISGYRFDFIYTLRCEIVSCTATGYYRIPALIFDDAEACVLGFEELPFDECLEICDGEPYCQGVARFYDIGCAWFNCFDVDIDKTHAELFPGIDVYIKVCLSSQMVCHPNGTIVYNNPDSIIYTDAMAIQNEGTSSATKCSVSVLGPRIIITGCNTDLEINVFFSNRSNPDSGDTFAGLATQSYKIRCDQLSSAGVERLVEDFLGATLEVTTQDAVTPSFTVSSALRSHGSQEDPEVSGALVGASLYWTIDVPSDYSARPSCTAYSGSDSSGSPNIELFSDGCTQDGDLIEDADFSAIYSMVAFTNRYYVTLYVFQFYNSEQVYFECSVKVCPSGSSACDYSCSKKRSIANSTMGAEGEVFRTGHVLTILGGNSAATTLGSIWLLIGAVLVALRQQTIVLLA